MRWMARTTLALASATALSAAASRVRPKRPAIGAKTRAAAAESISMRPPRIGTGRARAHAQHAALVHPDDRSAAGANGVDVDDGDADRQAVEIELLRQLRRAIGYNTHVRRGSTDVERDEVAVPGAGSLPHGADHTSRGTRQKRVDGVGAHGLGR